jgi:hypothetical protein
VENWLGVVGGAVAGVALTGGLKLMDSVMMDFALDSGSVSEVQEFSEEAVYRYATSDGLDAGEQHAGTLGHYGRRDSVQ